MPPKKAKETAEDKARRRTRQGAEMLLKLDRDNVMRLVRSFDAAVHACKARLQAASMWVEVSQPMLEQHESLGQRQGSAQQGEAVAAGVAGDL